MASGLVIIGGSYAACEIAQAARSNGYDGRIRILTDEMDYPYHRPPLSKGFLLDTSGDGYLPLKGEKFYLDQRIDIEFGATAKIIDIRDGRLILANESAVAFDKLALAVGARARRLPVPGADLRGVVCLRSLADARRLKSALGSAAHVVVIGGGFIGLEVASAAVQLGKSVTVLEAQPDLLMRVVSRPIARCLHDEHRKNGVAIRTGAKVTEIRGHEAAVQRVLLDDGTSFEADLVVVGVGSLPNSELASAAGLLCRDGVVVDRYGQTSHAGIWAAGDCTFFAGPFTPEGMRLESVQNAMDQARCVGASIAGVQKAYDAIPWFWSDQYKFKLQITGISKGYDSFVERISSDGTSVFYFKDERCIAVDTINHSRDHMASRRVIPMGVNRSQLEEVSYDLSELMRSRSKPEEARQYQTV